MAVIILQYISISSQHVVDLHNVLCQLYLNKPKNIKNKIYMELLLNGYSFCLGLSPFLEIDSGDGCTTLWIQLMPLSCIFKFG